MKMTIDDREWTVDPELVGFVAQLLLSNKIDDVEALTEDQRKSVCRQPFLVHEVRSWCKKQGKHITKDLARQFLFFGLESLRWVPMCQVKELNAEQINRKLETLPFMPSVSKPFKFNQATVEQSQVELEKAGYAKIRDGWVCLRQCMVSDHDWHQEQAQAN